MSDSGWSHLLGAVVLQPLESMAVYTIWASEIQLKPNQRKGNLDGFTSRQVFAFTAGACCTSRSRWSGWMSGRGHRTCAGDKLKGSEGPLWEGSKVSQRQFSYWSLTGQRDELKRRSADDLGSVYLNPMIFVDGAPLYTFKTKLKTWNNRKILRINHNQIVADLILTQDERPWKRLTVPLWQDAQGNSFLLLERVS